MSRAGRVAARIAGRARHRLALVGKDDYEQARVIARAVGLRSAGERLRITGKVEFGSEPFLIDIGSDVTLADGVIFVNHDGGLAVLRREHPGLNRFGRIVIGDNVFVGAHTVLMPGVTIGSNVVIGAGSVVTTDVPGDSVVAGSPARKIKDLDEYRRDAISRGVQITAVGAERERQIIAAVDRPSRD